jgi:putative nucleotidyltransferase with HDIG domain
VLARLQEGGAQAHVVGGSVRDVLLERPLDRYWDIATSRTPDEVRACFTQVEGIGERHGTVLVVEGDTLVECTTFRREGDYSDARRPDEVWYTLDALEDLARRDLTVNALAFDPVHGVLLDPFEGARDLARRRLRAVGDPHDRLREDALRALRVARFAAVLGMEVEPETREALAGVVERALVWRSSACASSSRSSSRRDIPRSGSNSCASPGSWHCGCPNSSRAMAWGRTVTMRTTSTGIRSTPVMRRRWTNPSCVGPALLHDIGKPATRAVREDGEATFYSHEIVGAEKAEQLLLRLRCSNDFRTRVVHLVREHMFDYRATWSDAAVRRFVRRVGVEHLADLFDVRMADSIGNGLKVPDVDRLEALSARVEAVLSEAGAISVEDLAIGGAEVMAVLGIAPGRRVGEALEALLEAVIEDPYPEHAGGAAGAAGRDAGGGAASLTPLQVVLILQRAFRFLIPPPRPGAHDH